MKKAVVILIILLLMFSIVSCSDGSETSNYPSTENIVESITEKFIETVTDDELCSVPTVPSDYNVSSNIITVRSDYTNEVKTLYGDDEEFFYELIGNAKWTEGTANCFYDCSINFMGRILYYHSYCGVIADVKNKCSFSLTKNQIHKMNVIISKYEEDSGIATSYSIKSKEGIDLSVSLSENPVKSGERFVLTATVIPENATDGAVVWTSDNEEVVTVDGGVVTANSVGVANITASAGDKSAICKVTVTPRNFKITWVVDGKETITEIAENLKVSRQVT